MSRGPWTEHSSRPSRPGDLGSRHWLGCGRRCNRRPLTWSAHSLRLYFPSAPTDARPLRPLWAEEAMHRAMGFMRLTGAAGLDRTTRLDHDIARDLAFQFRKLEAGDERRVLPCSAVLRNVIAGLGTLFGGPANVIVEH